MKHEIAIVGGEVASTSGLNRRTVVIDAGRVSAVVLPDATPSAHRVVDAQGLVVMPGLVDTHVHLRDPGRPDRETFTSGTAAAAAGGVTTICEMPTSDPPVNSAQVLLDRAQEVQPRALVDFALYGGAGPENLEQIAAMAEAGAVAFKTWLHAPAVGREHEFLGLACPDPKELKNVMAAVAATGKIHAMHCENEEVLARALAQARRLEGAVGRVHAASRPIEAENVSVAHVLQLAATIGARVQVVHMSSPEAVRLVAQAKRQGVQATVETCPHYLTLTEETLFEHGPFAKCNPPLRPASVVEELWNCLRAGMIDVIGTDHCPYLPEELTSGCSDIFSSPAGLPGLETMLPTLLTARARGQLGWGELVSLTSERAARLFGLVSKGEIAPGRDADLVLVDPKQEWTFDASRTFSKAGLNARYLSGQVFTGLVVATWLRGRQVFSDGAVTAAPGTGRFVTPKSAR